MPKKEDINIVRAGDFQQVDEDLTTAMQHLDDANHRIEELLQSREAEVPGLDAAAEDDGEESGEDPAGEDAPATETTAS